MLAELEMLQEQSRQAARGKFLAAAWRQRPAEELLELAHQAGMSGAEADELIAEVRKAAEQVARVERLPRLRKDADDAEAKLEKASARAEEEIEKLNSEVRRAGFQSEEAFKAVYAAEADARELLVLHDKGLLLTDVPREVARLVERREAEEKVHVAHRAMREAMEARDRCRHIARSAEEALAHAPIVSAQNYERQQDMLKERLKDAKRRLDEAESKLKKANAALDAARRAVPQM